MGYNGNSGLVKAYCYGITRRILISRVHNSHIIGLLGQSGNSGLGKAQCYRNTHQICYVSCSKFTYYRSLGAARQLRTWKSSLLQKHVSNINISCSHLILVSWGNTVTQGLPNLTVTETRIKYVMSCVHNSHSIGLFGHNGSWQTSFLQNHASNMLYLVFTIQS